MSMTPDDYNRWRLRTDGMTYTELTQLVRDFQNEYDDLASDGKFGDQTRARLALLHRDTSPQRWDPWDGPLDRLPRSRAEVIEIFGNPGAKTLDGDWHRRSIVDLHGRSRLPGVPSRWYVQVHRLAAPYLREGLRRASVSSDYVIRRIGGFNYRHIRFRASGPLSEHAYGIAVDIDGDAHNHEKQWANGEIGPAPWSPAWMAEWPNGIDRQFVDAMRSVGWRWGGDWRGDGTGSNYQDPMHWGLLQSR